ncbi:PEP/pyruvate-binding domain-containing protein [Desulfovibrio sp. SGI.169]|uniref:PEP/pyruvate-binding domain-containing protein n=1 Tax=Desulfovibrio sp. SGI.169 TaxID=3420561 RepID=UPI003D072947
MSLSRLLGFLTRSTKRNSGAASADSSEAERFFALRHHSFKLFLTAWNKFQETMTEVEYTLCCDHPFGLYRVRALCTSVATQVFQCIQQLERLDPAPGPALSARFAELQKTVAAEVYEPESCLLGPLTLPLGCGNLDDADAQALVDPATARLEALRKRFPEVVPSGFVVTAAGCQHFFQSGELQSEINRRVQAAGGFGPEHLAKLSESLGSLVESTPLPADLAEAALTEVRALRARCQRPMRLLLRGRLWPRASLTDDAAESAATAENVMDPGLLLWGPSAPLDAPDEAILQALHVTLARKQRAQALIYRRARGLTEADAGVCVTCLAVEEGAWGGLAHTGNPLQPHGANVHVYACEGLPQDMEYSALPVDMLRLARAAPHEVRCREPHDPKHPVLDDATALRVAELALALEKAEGHPLSLTWVRVPGGGVRLLLVRPMMLAADAGALPAPDEAGRPPLLAGGVTVNPGRACGPAMPARNWEEARLFPQGGILVVPDDSYLWASLMDRAAGVIAERGLPGSRLGSLAREFGKPALFGLKGALDMLARGQKITLCADLGSVYQGQRDELLAGAAKPRDFMPGSPVFRILQHAAAHILPLTIDVDSADFRAVNCATYHDIARYCHEKAVSAMFALGAEKRHAPQRVKQLRDTVLKQFWVVNLSDGFTATPTGPVIDVERIASRPMLALWRGMNAHPWQGPPPVDGKGFLSVLFEATANPHLDPAAQTAYFSEKNYFMISREYCSLHSRFGFHFVSVEARLGARSKENYLLFQLRGGAANIERRILRVRFVADLLWEFGFAPVLRNDAVSARLEGMDIEEGEHLLAVVGYMTIHTRQLDMIMQDSAQVAARREEMLAHCRALFTGRALPATAAQEVPPCR